jgi:hypothetical protein
MARREEREEQVKVEVKSRIDGTKRLQDHKTSGQHVI